MKLFKLLNIIVLTCLLTISLNSCGDDEPTVEKPTINLTEVGHDNSRHAHPGYDMHLEAEIVAPGTINSIHVSIEQLGGSTIIKKDFVKGKYIDVKNTEFHEHIDIPATTPLGRYMLYVIVVDKLGQQTYVSCEITMEEGGEEHD